MIIDVDELIKQIKSEMKCRHINGGYQVQEIENGIVYRGYKCLDCDEWLRKERVNEELKVKK